MTFYRDAELFLVNDTSVLTRPYSVLYFMIGVFEQNGDNAI